MKFSFAIAAFAALLVAAPAHAGSAFISQNGGAALLAADTGTVADPYALGPLDSRFSSAFVTLSSAGSFTEYASFTLPAGFGGTQGAANTYALIVALPSGPLVIGNIADFSESVIAGTPAAPGAVVGSGYGAGSTYALSDLGTGTYFLRLSGVVQGVGGQYSASIAAMPVPEPASGLLMLTGMGAIGLLAHSRRRRIP